MECNEFLCIFCHLSFQNENKDKVLEIIKSIKTIGNNFFKEQKIQDAKRKYKKALIVGFYSASSLKQQSVGRHVAPLGHIILIPCQPVFALSS
jgi:uncharacterized membrane-anchored protein YjiN (DUF445 family)